MTGHSLVFDVPSCSSHTCGMERTLSEVGQMVAKRRMELHLDAAELARIADVDPKTLASLEKGERWPRDKSRSRIEQALRWTPGSLSQIRAGKPPTVTGLIRGRNSRIIQKFASEDGTEQETLRLLRLASIVWDARDLVRATKGPLMTALTSLLEEASDLVVYAVAGYDSEPDDIDSARQMISDVRAGNSIRREGDLYVAEDMPPDDPFLARIGLRPIPQFEDADTQDDVDAPSSRDVNELLLRTTKHSAAGDLTPNDAPPPQDELDLAARTAPPGYQPPGQAARDAQDLAADENDKGPNR